MLSVALGYWVNPAWFLFTGFVGLNLFQSAFPNWCPMMTFLRKLGVDSAEHPVRTASPKLSLANHTASVGGGFATGT
jgi:hypothetical protein